MQQDLVLGFARIVSCQFISSMYRPRDPMPHSMEATGQAIDKASAESATTYQPGATPQVAMQNDFRGLKARPILTQEFHLGRKNRQTNLHAEHPLDQHPSNPWEYRRNHRSGLQLSILRGAYSWGVAPGWYVVAPPALMHVAIPKRHAFHLALRRGSGRWQCCQTTRAASHAPRPEEQI